MSPLRANRTIKRKLTTFKKKSSSVDRQIKVRNNLLAKEISPLRMTKDHSTLRSLHLKTRVDVLGATQLFQPLQYLAEETIKLQVVTHASRPMVSSAKIGTQMRIITCKK